MQPYLWLLFTGLMWMAAFFLVPRASWNKFILLGAVGSGIFFVAELVFVNFLGSWSYVNPGISFLGAPVLLAFLFIAENVLFSHYLPANAGERVLYLLSFGGAFMVGYYFLVRYNMLVYHNGDLLWTFVWGVAYHSLVFVLYTTITDEPEARN